MKFKIGDIITIKDIHDVCRETCRSKSSWNIKFFECLSGKPVKIIGYDETQYMIEITQHCGDHFVKGYQTSISKILAKLYIPFSLPDRLFEMGL